MTTYAVVLAGGGGTRLWPMARAGRPKQFLSFDGHGTLFEQACRRAAAVATRARVLVVCGRQHVPWVRRQAPWIPAGRILVEGVGRNTAASVALAAHWIARRAGDGTMVVLSSDHRIAPLAAFRGDILRAVAVAREKNAILILGVPATRPETGYGYILPHGRPGPRGVAPVVAFIEKPTRARARRLMERGNVLWNCGLFIVRVSTLLDTLSRTAPRIAAEVRRALPPARSSLWKIPARSMRRIAALPVDEAVVARAGDVRVLRASFSWSDLGTWDAIAEMVHPDADANGAVGSLVAVDARRCMSINPGGITMLVGVRDLVVVRQGEAVLVSARGTTQRVRDGHLRLTGRLASHV